MRRRSSAQAWKRSLIWRSSRSRPTNGASSPSDLSAPRAPDTTLTACHTLCRPTLPLSSCVPASSYTMVGSVARRVVSPTSTWPGSASVWMRAAVFTMSPATKPSPARRP